MRISIRTALPIAMLVGAFALAGCGGGGSNTPVPAADPMDPTPPKDCTMEGYALDQDTNECVKTAEQQKQEDMAAADAKARTDNAKSLKAALAATITNVDAQGHSFTTDAIPSVDGTAPTVTLEKSMGAVASLGGWNGADYEGDDGATGADKHTGMARIYSNQAAPKGVHFNEQSSGLTETNGKYGLTPNAPGNMDISSTMFPSAGRTTYVGDERKFAGTFKGAMGTYECTGSDCTASGLGAGEGVVLSSGWTFTPNPGATIMEKDMDYLYFGWWVRKDNDGDPTHAHMVYGHMGTPGPIAGDPINTANLQGSATYTGKAAGKYAVSDPRTLCEIGV